MSSALPQIGADLSAFMMNAMPFITGAKLIDSAALDGVKSLVGIILALTGANILDSLTSWFTGGTSLAKYGEEIAAFAPYIKTYADTVKGIDGSAVEASANAAKALGEMAANLPNSGGVAGWFAGENDLGKFGEQLVPFATHMKEYAAEVAGIDSEAINNSTIAAKALSELATNLPNSGGVAGWFAGENDMSSFGTQLVAFGSGMKEFSTIASEINTAALDSVSVAIAKVVEMLRNVSNLDPSVASGFSESLSTLATTGIDSFISTFDGSYEKVTACVAGMISKVVDVTADGKEGVHSAFFSVGTSVVDGFVAGISENTFKAEAQAKAMAKAAEEAAKAELAVNSPSKKFMTIGGSVVEGFGKGITKNLGDVEDSAGIMANTIVDATKSELKINSPSLVMNEQGHYVVQGIAEGIKSDMSAEDAAEKKAQNIVEAFRKVFDAYARKSEGKQLDLDYWKMTGGQKASQEEIRSKELAFYQDKLNDDLKNQSLAWDKVLEMQKNFGANSKEAEEALNEWKGYRQTVEETLDVIDGLTHDWDSRISNNEKAVEKIDTDQELWLKTDGLKASEIEKETRYIDDAKNKLNLYNSSLSAANEAYLYAIENYASDSEQVYNALQEVKKWEGLIADEQNNIKSLEQSKFARIDSEIQNGIEHRNRLLDYWNNTTGLNATEEQKRNRQAITSKDNLYALKQGLSNAWDEYYHVLANNAPDSDAVKQAWDKVQDYRDAIANAEKTLIDLDTEKFNAVVDAYDENISDRESAYKLWEAQNRDTTTEAEKDAKYRLVLQGNLTDIEDKIVKKKERYNKLLKEGKAETEEAKQLEDEILNLEIDRANTNNQLIDLAENEAKRQKNRLSQASENADLEYQVWEATAGRNLSSWEKYPVKVASLNRQIANQTSILELAKQDWDEAVSEHGSDSEEAQAAYATYLREWLELANTQNEITDLNKKNADKQRLARSEYENYMKDYKKYYLANGMTLEDLERDAKLVSGYDPTKPVTNLVNNLTNNTTDAFSNMGDSFISAVNSGIKGSTETVTTTTSTVISSCAAIIEEQQESWVKAGQAICSSLAEGIQKDSSLIIERMIDATTSALISAKQNRSSWVSAGKYLVQGFATGISNGSSAAIDAAVDMAASALAAAKAELDINSPSRAFATVGMYSAKGFAEGISNNTNLADDAVTNLGKSAINNLRQAISRIAETVESDIDTQPTIRPVLDLTNVRSGTAKLNTMLNNAQVATISAGMSNNYAGEIQNGVNPSSTGGTINFTQNNYSPKALSAVDIYRQTKNQFTAMKEVLKR